MKNHDSLSQHSLNRRWLFFFSRTLFQKLPAFALLLLSVGFAHLDAAQLKEARVTQVIRNVELIPAQAAPRPAAVSDEVRNGTAVRTGTESRAELTFTDQTLARLGANTIFSFNKGTRNLELGGGAMLLRVPKDVGGAQINTAAVTAAITGTTVMLEYHPDAFIKFIILEGTGRIFRNNRVGESVLLHAGQMLIVSPKGTTLPDPVDVDLDRLSKTSALLSSDFAPLSSTNLIAQEIKVQEQKKAENALLDTNLVIFGGGTAVSLIEATATIDQRIAVTETTARESPSPTPRPTPSPNSDAQSDTFSHAEPQLPTPSPTPSPTPRPHSPLPADNSHTESNTFSHTESNSHSQSNPFSHAKRDSYSDADSDTEPDTYTDNYTNPLSDDHPHTNSDHHSATGGLGYL